MNAQQMQELCRELVGALRIAKKAMERELLEFPIGHEGPCGPWVQCDGNCEASAYICADIEKLSNAIARAEQAFNPTPAPNGCVETAATVSACVGTGETDKALGVGPCCPVCGARKVMPVECDEVVFMCGGMSNGDGCDKSALFATTRAKQLAKAEAVLTTIEEKGGFGMGGAECGEKAADYFRNKHKEPTA